jgi:hypothetical protein
MYVLKMYGDVLQTTMIVYMIYRNVYLVLDPSKEDSKLKFPFFIHKYKKWPP